jgi:L-alanine-DL-glutamate epimerase-like enolase superfamily enzyme
MKIQKLLCRMVNVLDEGNDIPESVRVNRIWRVSTLQLWTDQGVDGLGFAFTLGGLNSGLFAVLEELAELVIGEDPTRIEPILAKLRRAAGTAADTGLFLLAQAAIDMALWDIRGKMVDLPLWRLVGGSRTTVPGYSSGSIPREISSQEAISAAERIGGQGFSWVKMHLALPGASTPEREAERAKLVRQALGHEIRLGCDINARWRVDEAVNIGQRLDDVGLAWIEDPTRHDDYAGMAEVRQALSTPIMAGESNWGVSPFRLMIAARSVDILMIDVMTVGGITAWLKVAAMAEAFGIPVVSHLLPELQAHLVAGVPNGLLAEHKTWIWHLFDEVPTFNRGSFILPERPGNGLSLSDKVLKHS